MLRHPANRAHHEGTPRSVVLAERFAGFLGSVRFLVLQTSFIAVWIALNVVGLRAGWDPYPFILLNLMFSTQAAYAAPLILLAQNRQASVDRARSEHDYAVNEEALLMLHALHKHWHGAACSCWQSNEGGSTK
jgi:uncharacterized membrane protein